MWVGVMIAIIVVGVISFVVNYLTPFGHGDKYARRKEKSFANNLYHIYAMYLEQSELSY